MIVFNLRCANDHVFEAWFNSSDTYEKQLASEGVICPQCGDSSVVKAPMAPNVATGPLAKWMGAQPSLKLHASTSREMDGSTAESEAACQGREALIKLRSEVEATCSYVGDKFADEARKIHYGETDSANIYGEATTSEEIELREEGVAFGRIPWLPRSDS